MGTFEGKKRQEFPDWVLQMNMMPMCFHRMLMMFITWTSTDGLTCWISDIWKKGKTHTWTRWTHI